VVAKWFLRHLPQIYPNFLFCWFIDVEFSVLQRLSFT
jgi:hypothetical protein